MILDNPDFVVSWLKTKKKKNLYSFGNAMSLTIGFADLAEGQKVRLSIRDVKKTKTTDLFKLYNELKDKEPPHQMLWDWMRMD